MPTDLARFSVYLANTVIIGGTEWGANVDVGGLTNALAPGLNLSRVFSKNIDVANAIIELNEEGNLVNTVELLYTLTAVWHSGPAKLLCGNVGLLDKSSTR